MIGEIRRRWVACVRIHVSEDFYSAEYVRKWAAVARACPATRFYAYTRSWRRPDIAAALAELSRCRNVRLWYSCDRDTGIPARVPRPKVPEDQASASADSELQGVVLIGR
jgi:hypothetical protein